MKLWNAVVQANDAADLRLRSLNLAIYERFAAEGVEFAYPTRTVFLRRERAPQRAPLAAARRAPSSLRGA